MSGNQKQPATGGPQTQRYSSSPYQPILTPNSYTGSDAFHNPTTTYVSQTQGPNQGPGLRNIQPTGPPNQPSTPPNSELKVPNLQGPIPQMQFVQGPPVRTGPGPFFQSRGAGGPPTQASRMPNQQHRAQGPPPQIYSSPYVVQPLYIPQQTQVYYGNQRNPNTVMAPQSFTPQMYTQPITYQAFPSPASSGVPSYGQVAYPIYQQQTGSMPIARTSVTQATAAPSNTTSGNLQNPSLMAQPGPTHNNYTRSNIRQRRPNALSIIDPATGQDKLDEMFDEENVSHPASGESSARQTPQPAPPNPNKEVQAAFAKQVAQVLNEDRQQQPHDQRRPSHEPLTLDQFHVPPPHVIGPRCDIQNSNLQYDAKEFVSVASKQPIKESTPIVSANSDAAEVILSKKDRESPVKSRKQQQPKPEIPKEFQPKETDCDRSSSIVKEEVVPVPQPTVVNIQVPVPEISPVIKETVKESVDKKDVKKPTLVEHKSSETESLPPIVTAADVSSNSGKSKNARNKNLQHNQNGKPQGPPPSQQPPPTQPPALPVPAPQPPKPNNKSNKSKELNLKGANKEGTDMDAFNDNSPKVEINANVLLSPIEAIRAVSNDVVNANSIPKTVPAAAVVPPPTETDKVISETRKIDSNENVTTIKPETVNANNVIPATTTAPTLPVNVKPASAPVFSVMSIVKEAPKSIVPPFPISDSRDETDKAAANDKAVLIKNEGYSKVSSENSVNDSKLPELRYGPDQWSKDNPNGKKVYGKDFLMALRNYPASRVKPPNILENVLSDERSRQLDGRPSMGGRTDFINPPFPNYGGKSGSQRGAISKRSSQSGKMGSRSGDKAAKPQPKVSISLRGDVKLHEAENAWKPARFLKGENQSDEDKKTEYIYRKIRAILNKLTPQKYDTLANQVEKLQIDTKERLQGVIDLVFEKATDEPNFATTYSRLCKGIQNVTVTLNDEKRILAFRTLLVTRCQMEFEKQSIDETTRNNKLVEIDECADPEKHKELLFDLEEYDRRLRMKSVGTIRFIGELFKQQMLTANIMSRCLQTLLDNRDEESLECLCKLLTTIGKDLGSAHGKDVELNSIFQEMKRITVEDKPKVSSRIRFMLQDVIDLRDSKWVPRRGDLIPKTIDQIQREAETEQVNIAMNVNVPRKDERGVGPRGGGGGGPRQKVSDDGWSSVGPRNRQQPFSIQTDKMRAPKLPMLDEPLGSSQLFGNWGKGAGGAKNQKPSGLNTNMNMFTALEGVGDTDRRPMNSRGNKDPYSSKGPSMERNSYKSYDGRGSRSGSQHRDSAAPLRSTGPPPSSMVSSSAAPQQYQAAAQPAVVPPQTSLPKLTKEQIERRIHNSLDEFITSCCTDAEYFQDIASIVSPGDYSKVVFESYNYIIEKSQTARLKTGLLFVKLIKSGSLSIEDWARGFDELLSIWKDLVIDIPQIFQYYAEDIVPLLLEEVLPIHRLHKLLDSLIQNNEASKLLTPLFSLVIKENGPNFLLGSWQNSGLQLSDFMPEADVQSFVERNKLEFLLGGNSPVGQSPHSFEDIQRKLSEFLQNKASFDDIVNWISANVGSRIEESKFIRALATAIFEDSISKNKLQPEVLASHMKLIQKYVDNNTNYELQCLYALQSLVHKLEHPQGLLLSICDKLYEETTFCQESFIAWENSSDPGEQEGKGVALKQLTSFFTQLKENEEDEEFSSTED